MHTHVALAYSGTLASSAAIRWLIDTYGAEVAAVIVDVGQTDDLEEVYARALASGAMRAHVVDRRDAFVRTAVFPALASDVALDAEALRRLAHPVVAAALAEVAAIEGADTVAHASRDHSLDEALRRTDPALRVVAAAREWAERGVDACEYVRMHHLSQGALRAERHLLIRRSAPLPLRSDAAAFVTIGFDGRMPVSVNGVAMAPVELLESASLIGGQYSLGSADAVPAPAAVLLRAAYRASGGRGTVTLQLQAAELAVVPEREPAPVARS